MVKNKVILFFGVLLACFFLLSPTSHAFTVESNGSTVVYPDFDSDMQDIYRDFIIYTKDNGDTYASFFKSTDTSLNPYIHVAGASMIRYDWDSSSEVKMDVFKLSGSIWRYSTSYNQTSTEYIGIQYADLIASNNNIYYTKDLEDVFFHSTPTSLPFPRPTPPLEEEVLTLEEVVKAETQATAEKIIQIMKVIVVSSISCLILLISLVVFSRVFSTFQVK